MTAIANLIERLEKAEGASLELDGMIWCAANGYEFVMWDGAGCVYRDPNAPNWNRGIQHADASTVRPYSASLDAAVALAERKLPGWRILTEHGDNYSIVQFKRGWGARTEVIGVATAERADDELCLCLCTATLKALEATRT